MDATASALPKSEPAITAAASQDSASSLPPITVHRDAEAAAKFNALTARVFTKEPLTIIFRLEINRPQDRKVSEEHVLKGNAARIARKLADGGVIIEAGNWAAAAIWDPPGALVMGPPLTAEQREKQPVFAEFMDGISAAKLKYMGEGQKYWHLSLMARNPAVQPPIKGAVRAVIEPYLRKAEEDGIPIWIEAGGARARDVYGYMGFELLEETRHGVGKYRSDGYPAIKGEDAPGVPTWFMIYNRPRSQSSASANDIY